MANSELSLRSDAAMSGKNTESYSEILKEIQKELCDKSDDEFRRIISERLAALHFELVKIKKKQQSYASAMRLQRSFEGDAVSDMKLARHFEFDMRDAVDAIEGFYPLEYGEGGPYRWTGLGPTATFRAWLDRSVPMYLDAAVRSFGDERNRADVTLLVDGIEIPVRCTDKNIRSEAFPVSNSKAATEVVFRIPHTFCPQDRGESDSRTLGVCFEKLQVVSEDS
jgi:hypothetical protein